MEIDLHFPKKGLDVSRPAGEFPVYVGPNNERHYSCADCLNVCSWDVLAGRQRGGSRNGFSKWIAAQGRDTMTQELFSLVGSGYNPPGGGAVQPSFSGRVVTLVKVDAGYIDVANPDDLTWTTPTNSAVNTPPLNASGLVYAAPSNQKLYFADGTDDRVYYDPATNVVDDWTASAGSMPVDGTNGPRLICLWRNRIIQSGIVSDPQNIFAAKVGDPTNFDYSPADPSATDAWALNLTDQGEIGDVVTGLVPCTDDVLVVLGDHSIHKLVGDPLNGGSSELVTDAIGGAWGQAWCKGPDGTIFFFSNVPGVYALPPRAAGQPVRISHQIDPRLKDVDTGNTIIRLFWDDLKHGFWLFITDDDGAAGNHWFYEAVRPDGSGGGWFPVEFANADHNPTCGCVVDGNDADDRALVMGGFDGYVRKSDPDALDDDGTPIASYVLIGPIMSPGMDERRVENIQGEMASGSADVEFDLQVGRTAEEAVAATPLAAVSDTFPAGRSYTKYVNRSAHYLYFKLSSVGRWAMERLRAGISDRNSKVRRRGY
jgi:hypothetical protein